MIHRLGTPSLRWIRFRYGYETLHGRPFGRKIGHNTILIQWRGDKRIVSPKPNATQLGASRQTAIRTQTPEATFYVQSDLYSDHFTGSDCGCSHQYLGDFQSGYSVGEVYAETNRGQSHAGYQPGP
jgi:hypothetical protein